MIFLRNFCAKCTKFTGLLTQLFFIRCNLFNVQKDQVLSIRTHLSIIHTTKHRNTRDSGKFLHRYKHTGIGLSRSFSSALSWVLLKDVFGYSSQNTFHMNFNKNILTKCDVSLLILLICIRYFITSGKIRSSKKHSKLATTQAGRRAKRAQQSGGLVSCSVPALCDPRAAARRAPRPWSSPGKKEWAATPSSGGSA